MRLRKKKAVHLYRNTRVILYLVPFLALPAEGKRLPGALIAWHFRATYRVNMEVVDELSLVALGLKGGHDGVEALVVICMGNDVYSVPRLVANHIHVEL